VIDRTLRLTIAYDGTELVGWQRQAEGVSVQGLLEDALARLDGRAVTVIGAGRTDAGVHALAQVASVQIQRVMAVADICRAVNAMLPPAVRVLDVAEAPAGFSARRAARSKTYWYRIARSEVLPPFDRLHAWHIRFPLDVRAMTAAARLLEGRHDFAGFRAAGSDSVTSVRTIHRSIIHEESVRGPLATDAPGDLPLLVYDVTGDGFLRYMVRNIVGTLVEIGAGRFPVQAMADVLEGRDRAQAGPTAPAHGLVLARVTYDES
jgi:tRNA pseudouridine38-40 synthase